MSTSARPQSAVFRAALAISSRACSLISKVMSTRRAGWRCPPLPKNRARNSSKEPPPKPSGPPPRPPSGPK
ncbi:hypothetical protein [Actinoalloteichus caeruleus]|uniref:hypothetical protein n=1 Tax=Actinoalloteichus cyanogriseus TaxID=2893586 RepID=UPI0020A33DE1|nr:hypothetical protein [Actinoalloteichus caeruleus]